MEWTAVENPEYPDTSLDAYSGLVNGVLNLETKSVTGLALNDEPLRSQDLYDRVRKMIGTDDFGESTPRDYCRNSFEDIGLVTKAVITDTGSLGTKNPVAYSASDFGKDVQPVLSYHLKYVTESENIESMRHILGSTSSGTDNRSPLNRSKVLYQIGVDDFPRVTSIAEEQDLDPAHVPQIVSRLEESSAIKWRKSYYPGGTNDYRVLEPDPEDYSHTGTVHTLTDQIVDLLEEDSVVNVDIFEQLDGHRTDVSRVLADLARQDVLEPFQRLELTETGKEAIEFLDTTARYTESLYDKNRDPPQEVRKAWELYSSNTSKFNSLYTSSAWRACWKQSSFVDKVSKNDGIRRVEEILQELSEQGKAPTTSTIHKYYNEKFDDRTRHHIAKRLREAESIEGEKWEKNRREKIWWVEENEE
ncbi:hypothetical protein [Natrarchaeobius chitinivorans]|uniref:hypothetical protein n=1 Tax=Natrarchaeobius chitinivorans TaxID=1679083 RepID=UPI000F51FAAD|nr:hypothetical protein [Natrarchaeobius chitinivorans]